MSILFDTSKRSLNRELVDPESSVLVETVNLLDSESRRTFADEWLRLFNLCLQDEAAMDSHAYEKYEPIIVKEFTEKYGCA